MYCWYSEIFSFFLTSHFFLAIVLLEIFVHFYQHFLLRVYYEYITYFTLKPLVKIETGTATHTQHNKIINSLIIFLPYFMLMLTKQCVIKCICIVPFATVLYNIFSLKTPPQQVPITPYKHKSNYSVHWLGIHLSH